MFRYGRETAERFGIVETGQRILESCTVWMDRVGISLNTGALLACYVVVLINFFGHVLTRLSNKDLIKENVK